MRKRSDYLYGKWRNKGVASIEFVLGFFVFWLMCMAWVEMSFMSYVSSLGDLAVSQAARQSKKQHGEDFLHHFRQVLEQQDSLWHYVVDSNKFQLSIQYLESYDELSQLSGSCVPSKNETEKECGKAKDSAIALYRISYDYKPIFSTFLTSPQLFSREMMVIQEYQRDKFKF